MSNLVKQYYVANSGQPTRIINSNDRVAKKLQELARTKRVAAGGPMEENDFVEGFVGGLTAKVVEIEPEVTPEDLIEQAKVEAKQLVAEAQEQADLLMQDAVAQADALFEEKKTEGYMAGKSQGEQEIARLRQQIAQEQEERSRALEAEYQSRLETMESDLIDVITKVFAKVFGIQFDNKKEILLYLVNNILKNVQTGKLFRIRVGEENVKFFKEHLEEIRERLGSDVEVEVVNDGNLTGQDCQIETGYGVFDCGIDMELNNLIKDIRSLCIS